MDDNFKFITSVDPSKCRTKIKERFAKLTLSSNKKKQEESEMSQDIRDEIVEKRISRNLLSELLTDDESDKDEAARPSVTNLLMRSDSSSTIGNQHLHNATDTTHCSQFENAQEKSLEMEPLIVSCLEENTQQLDTEIEKLSSRVSSLAVTAAPALTISSDESEVVSTQHQRIASGPVCSPIRLRPELKKEADVSICISSSSEELQEDDDEPIVISDSSDDDEEIQPTQQPQRQDNQDEEPNVSSIHDTTTSSNNMCVVKANQMAAFLRDVRRNYGLSVDTPDKDFERRQREIATADTEPMTADNDSRSAGTAHRIATADTEPMSESTEKHPSPNSNKRLALDDTEDMTMANESMHTSLHYNPVMRPAPELLDDSVHRSSDPIPDDSLTIAETSDEKIDESDHEESQNSRKLSNSQRCSAPSALKRSESLSQHRSTISSVSSGDTQVQINISAKINIKIQVSQQMDDSSASDLTDSNQSNEKSTSQSIEEQQTHNSAQKGMINHSRAIEEIPHSPPERDIPEKPPAVATPSEDFIDKAQELLNELYGNQWKTPQVLRSLQKVKVNSTSKSVRSKESSRNLAEKTREQTLPTKEPTRNSGQEFKNPANPEPTDESILGDFSIFRRNIPQDLDSTRLPSKFKEPNAITPISKPTRKQRKPAEPKPEAVNVTKTRSGREVRQKWRNIVDSDTESEGDNASNDSNHSWEKSNDEEEEEIENIKPPPTNRGRTKRNDLANLKNDDQLVYLDLSKDQVEIQHNVSDSPPANNDEVFKSRLQQILTSCKCEDKPQIKTPGGKSKRKLFSALVNEDLEEIIPPFDSPRERKLSENIDEESVSISGARMPARFEPFNKYLESVKTGKPIFKIQTPKPIAEVVPKTPKSSKKELREIVEISETPRDKYGFLKSLDLCVGKSNCHPDALYYRDNFRLKKEELATKLYEIYNRKCFNDTLNVPLVWNKKLTNTAGRCMNKKRLGERTCVVELSEKVLTSADRLRCTLIHELCHAATWILNGESGHGATWKAWARKANHIFPELPKIGVCHQYDIEYKYTYKCVLCGAKSYAHSKSKKVENIRCSYCHGAIEVYLNKKDKEGNAVLTPIKEPTGFAKFVKDKYKAFKRPDLKHADVMKLLSAEFASMKVDGNS